MRRGLGLKKSGSGEGKMASSRREHAPSRGRGQKDLSKRLVRRQRISQFENDDPAQPVVMFRAGVWREIAVPRAGISSAAVP